MTNEWDIRRTLHGLFIGAPKHANTTVVNQKGVVAVTSADGLDVQPVVDGLRDMQDEWSNVVDGKRHITAINIDDDVDADRFESFSHVLLCDDLRNGWKDEEERQRRADKLCHLLRLATKSDGNACIGLVGDPSLFKQYLQHLYWDYPEFRWLATTRRLLNITLKDNKWTMEDTANEILLRWLFAKTSPNSEMLLNYADMYQISVRYMSRRLPNMSTFIRLSVLTLCGLLSILFTAVVLAIITTDSAPERALRSATYRLRDMIILHRQGKGEWNGGGGPIALTALQLHEHDWLFQTIENQRSVDRLEIQILVSLSRPKSSGYDIKVAQLSHYINALVATYQNARNFHGHDLVLLLERHLLQQAPFLDSGIFAYSLAIISLHNSGVDIKSHHVHGLLKTQREDGSFGFGTDETSLAIIALLQTDPLQEVNRAIESAISYLKSSRQPDGSYGTPYATALVLQAFNLSSHLLTERQHEQTTYWLLRSIQNDPSVRNVDVAAQILILFSGKTLVSVGSMNDFDKLQNSRGQIPSVNLSFRNEPIASTSMQDENNNDEKTS